jgi:lipopolysaccharide export LptBFGC system permease protein LptF
MKTLDWYIIKTVFNNIFLCNIFAEFIAIVIDITEKIDEFIDNKAPFTTLFLITISILFLG